MLKNILLLPVLIGLASCAFDKNAGNDNAKEVEERQAQLAAFSPVIGTYSGYLTRASGRQDVQLRLFTLEERSGTNSNGESRYRVVLRGTYDRINPAGSLFNFEARYIPETGALILTNISSDLALDDIHTINAEIRGQRIVGEAKSISGPVGQVDLQLSSNSSNTGGGEREDEYYDRLRRQYQAIAGTYAGDNVVDGKTTFSFKIKLEVVDSYVNSKVVPAIVGTFTRDDAPENMAVTLNLTVIYRPDLNPPRLSIKGTPQSSTVAYTATFEGVLVEGVYTGSWSSTRRNHEGTFNLTKQP
ncbi:MAG: hypothetical protein AAGB31_04450 [Bdellovibrio sp.]